MCDAFPSFVGKTTLGLLAAAGLALALSAAPAAAPVDPRQQTVIDHLDATIQWYRKVESGRRWVFQPNDEYYWDNQRHLANQAVQEAFAWAEAEELAMAEEASSAEVTPGGTKAEKRAAALSGKAENAASRVRELGGRINLLDGRIQNAPENSRAVLIARRDTLQAELDLNRDFQQSFTEAGALMSGAEDDKESATFTARIDALKRSVSGAFGSTPAAPGGKAAPAPAVAPSAGLLKQAIQIFTLIRSRHELSLLADPVGPTGRLRNSAASLGAPLREASARIMQKSQAEEGRIGPDEPENLEAARREIESLTAEFKQVAAGLLALRRESIALEQSMENLQEWRSSFDARYDALIRSVAERMVVIAGALALLVVGSEIWRRATFRYVHDVRRRRQFLLIRRFATGLLMALVLFLGLLSNFGSLATYAGLITAGIAVALQSVILSVAGYFLLIGRYGISVGDRVTVSGVTGDVIEVGPIRFYLMELAATGVVLHPTGRLVVFPNSILFGTTPLYKQIPGTEYAWHEVAITLAPEADGALVESKILEAVNFVYAEYRPSLERQHHTVERLIDVRLDVPQPVAQIVYTDVGLDLVVRYPVDLHHGGDMDAAVSAKVLEAIRGEPKLRQGISGNPRIRAAVKT